MTDSRRIKAVSRTLRPRLSEQANRARALAQRYHARLLRARERKPGDLDEQQRLERNAIMLGSAGILLLFAVWCSVRAVPVVEDDVAAQVRTVLIREVAATWVQAEVFGREVRLFGIAPSSLDQTRVMDAVGELQAVTRVHDHLVVAAAPDRIAARASVPGDTAAAQGLPRSLSIVFDGTQLRLVGEIGDAQTTTAVVHDAERRFTAAGVSTELSLTAGASERWRQAASAAIATMALLDVANAELSAQGERELKLSLTGIAADITTLSAVRESLRQHAPRELSLQVDLVPILRDGQPDRGACRSALALLLGSGSLVPSGDFTGLDRPSRLTLDQIRALVQSCGAGLLIAASSPAPAGYATFADDLRAYLINAGLGAELVAIARVSDQDEPVSLQLVFQPSGEQEN